MGCVLISVHPCRSVASDCPDHQAGNGVDDDGNEEEREADLDERAKVEVAGSLGELACDDAGKGIGGCEEGLS